jgi:hypothetical protein
MSPAAIARRLKIVSELRDLATTLATAQRIGAEEPEPKASEIDLPQRAQKSQKIGETPQA